VYATVQGSNTVAVIDTSSLTLIKTIPVGPNPFGLSVSADRRKLWVANRSAPAVSAIDLETLENVASYAPTLPGFDVEEAIGGRLYVSTPSYGGLALFQIDLATGQTQPALVGSSGLSGGGLLAATPDRRTIFYGSTATSAGQISAVDVSTPTPTSSTRGKAETAVSRTGRRQDCRRRTLMPLLERLRPARPLARPFSAPPAPCSTT
jgi:YVTN family beta-propeller protein